MTWYDLMPEAGYEEYGFIKRGYKIMENVVCGPFPFGTEPKPPPLPPLVEKVGYRDV